MRRMFPLVLAILAITTTLAALEADNSLGTWKINTEASKYSPAPLPVKSLTVVREAAPGGVKVTSSGERTDGTAINATYSANYDGTPAGVTGTGAPYNTVSIKEVDSNIFLYEAKNSTGKYHASGRIVISNEGKTMTLTATGTDAEGKDLAVSLVYDKQ
jgi:hypothetical protein